MIIYPDLEQGSSEGGRSVLAYMNSEFSVSSIRPSAAAPTAGLRLGQDAILHDALTVDCSAAPALVLVERTDS